MMRRSLLVLFESCYDGVCTVSISSTDIFNAESHLAFGFILHNELETLWTLRRASTTIKNLYLRGDRDCRNSRKRLN
jgi:hypothetical protein